MVVGREGQEALDGEEKRKRAFTHIRQGLGGIHKQRTSLERDYNIL
jgi:hypothetical protein